MSPAPLRMPRRMVRLELDEDYTGFWVDLWSNPPLRTFMDIQSDTEFSVLREKMKTLVMDWNLADHEGEPIAVGDVEALSVDLFGKILNGYLQQVLQTAAVPKA